MPNRKAKSRACLGFGPFEDQCTNPAGPKSPFWCDRCEDLRRAYITKQLEGIAADMERRAKAREVS